jgi:hypothetical protein
MAMAFAFFIIAEAVSAAISFLFPAEGPRLKDLSVSASTYGNPIPQAFGTMRVAANMIWANPIKEHKTTQKAGLGSFYKQFTYTVDMAMALCVGPVQSIRRIWANGKIIYDATGASPSVNNGKYLYTFYPGDEEQLPDPIIQASVGASNTPAYRGICYIVFSSFLLTDFGNQIPQISVELYAGPMQATPYTNLTNDGSVELSGYGKDDPYTADFDRGVIYLYDANENGLITVDMTTGIKTGETFPMLVPEDYWDSGKLAAVWDVSSLGEILTTIGQQNLSRYARLDPFSLAPVSTVSHSIPGTGYSSYVTLDPPFIPAANRVLYDTAGELAILITYSGQIWYTDNLLTPSLTSALGVYGDIYTPRRACAVDTAAWALFWGGSLFDDTNTLTLSFITPVEFVDTSYLPFTLNNPDAGSGSIRMEPLAVVLDVSTDCVIMFFECLGTDNTYAAKYSRDSQTILWQVLLPHGFADNDYQAKRLDTAEIAWSVGGLLFIMDTSDGSFVNLTPASPQLQSGVFFLIDVIVGAQFNPGENGYTLPSGTGSGGQIYDGQTGNLICMGDIPRIVRVGYFANVAVDLSYVLNSLMAQTGLTPDQYDMSALAAIPVNGYGFAQMTDIKSVIEELTQIYLFDIVERDGKLVAVIRGGTESVETISYKVLSAQGSNDPNTVNFWKETRLSEADLPAQISLTYYNLEQDFETSTALSKRIFAPVPTMFSRQQEGVEATIAFHPDDAKNRVNAMLYTTWGERTKHETRFPLSYAYLDPTDLITVNLQDGRSYFERIMQMEMGADYSSNMNSSGQDSGVYSFNLTADGGTGFTQTVKGAQPARPFVFNTPYLRDTDAAGNGAYSIYYAGVGNMGPSTFDSAAMFIAPDDSSFALLDNMSSDVEWGTVQGVLAPPSHGCFALDWLNTVTIYPAISWFDIESITDDELWAGGNMAVIGDEVIQFRDVVSNADGSWTISNLLRGVRGTEWACDSHTAGETFVFLSAATIALEQKSIDSGGKDFWYKAVGAGAPLTTALTVEIEYECRDLMPYAPADIRRELNTPSSGDITITWERRTRLGGGLMDGTGDVPLNETSEAYQIYILSGTFDGDPSKPDLPDNIVRTYTSTSPTVVYTDSDQTSDSFDNATDTLHVVIYQMSGTVGRGFPGTRDIPASAFF